MFQAKQIESDDKPAFYRELKQQIEGLLENAGQAMLERRYVAPADNNALYFYRRVLSFDAANGEAVARLYQAKGRPSFNPLIAHIARTGNCLDGYHRLFSQSADVSDPKCTPAHVSVAAWFRDISTKAM